MPVSPPLHPVSLRRATRLPVRSLTGVLALAALAAPGAEAVPPGCWNIVPSPGTADCLLYRVAAASPTEVWAAGWCGFGTDAQTLIERWDGVSWTVVPSPDVGVNGSVLQGVAAISPGDAWAVGNHEWGVASPQTLAVHWDGIAWSVVPTPNDLTAVRGTYLRGISAVASNDVWAVGYSHPTVTDFRPYTAHWDGSAWSTVTPVSGPGILHEVEAVAADDVWAVGWTRLNQSLCMRWDGSSWNTVTTPNAGTVGTFLTGIAAIAPDDVWAVGWNYTQDGSFSRALTMHWDGTEWSIVPCPATDNYALYGVAAIAPDDVWAVGEASFLSLVLHWDGTAWSVVSVSDPAGATESYLWGVAAVSSADVWSVNYSVAGGPSATLVQRYTDPCGATAVAEVSAAREEMLRVSPTPARSRVEIAYTVPRPGPVRLAVYDVAGRLVRTVVDAHEAAGTRTAAWDGRDRAGRRVAGGVYRAVLVAGDAFEARAVVLAP